MANGSFAGGDGTMGNPYLIEDFDDIQSINKFPGGNFKLEKDIDLSGKTWVPLTEYKSGYQEYFSGVLDGDGKKISNLYYYGKSAYNGNDVGLFKNTKNATIKNLFIENIDITGYQGVTALVGESYENITISNVKITGKITSNMYTSSLISTVRDNKVINLKNIEISADITCTNYSMGALIGSTIGAPTIKINNVVLNSNIARSKSGIDTDSGYIISTYCGKNDIIQINNFYVNKDKCTKSGIDCLYSKTEDSTLKKSVLKTDEEMKQQSTYFFDFNNTWYMHSITGYPSLLLFQEVINKILIKDMNKYYTIQNNTLVEVVIPSVDQLENTIESNGFENIKDILYVKDKISKFEIKLKRTKI